jgi:hypothetical protein
VHCARDTSWYLHMCLKYILDGFYHAIVLPLSLPFRTISTGFIFLFSCMYTKYIHHTHPHSPYPWSTSLPPVPTPPALPLLHCVVIVQGCFFLVLQVGIYCILIKLTPSFSITMLLNIQQLTIQCIILYSYIVGLLQYFSFSLSPTSHTPSYRLINTSLFYMIMYIFIHPF